MCFHTSLCETSAILSHLSGTSILTGFHLPILFLLIAPCRRPTSPPTLDIEQRKRSFGSLGIQLTVTSGRSALFQSQKAALQEGLSFWFSQAAPVCVFPERGSQSESSNSGSATPPAGTSRRSAQILLPSAASSSCSSSLSRSLLARCRGVR